MAPASIAKADDPCSEVFDTVNGALPLGVIDVSFALQLADVSVPLVSPDLVSPEVTDPPPSSEISSTASGQLSRSANSSDSTDLIVGVAVALVCVVVVVIAALVCYTRRRDKEDIATIADAYAASLGNDSHRTALTEASINAPPGAPSSQGSFEYGKVEASPPSSQTDYYGEYF